MQTLTGALQEFHKTNSIEEIFASVTDVVAGLIHRTTMGDYNLMQIPHYTSTLRHTTYIRDKLVVKQWSDLLMLTKTGRKHDRKKLTEELEKQMKVTFKRSEPLHKNQNQINVKVELLIHRVAHLSCNSLYNFCNLMYGGLSLQLQQSQESVFSRIVAGTLGTSATTAMGHHTSSFRQLQKLPTRPQVTPAV